MASRWAWDAFSETEWCNPAVSGHSENPDGDAYANWIEYLFDLDPKTPENRKLLVPWAFTITNQGIQYDYPQVQFRIRTGATDVTWHAEVSDDLTQWRHNDDGAGQVVTEVVSIQTESDGMSVVLLRGTHLLRAGVPQYLRIVLDKPSYHDHERWIDR